jgi:hypothetical protein
VVVLRIELRAPENKPELFIFTTLLSLSQARMVVIHLHHQHSTLKKLDGKPHPFFPLISISSIKPRGQVSFQTGYSV